MNLAQSGISYRLDGTNGLYITNIKFVEREVEGIKSVHVQSGSSTTYVMEARLARTTSTSSSRDPIFRNSTSLDAGE